MPHLDARGLSENWLFRHAGDLHWEAIGRRLGALSDEIRSDEGERLYPTVVAARAIYEQPLSSVRENDVLESAVQVVACGRSCAHGRIQLTVGVDEARFSLELLTTFAVRESSGLLRMGLPAARLAARWTPVEGTPVIARLAKAARRGDPLLDDEFSGPSSLALDAGQPNTPISTPMLGRVSYEPSPYSDYNGAGLLYFASYVTIADTTERQIVRDLGLAGSVGNPRKTLCNPDGETDWALRTSAVRRDVFYYANLPLGESLAAELVAFEPDAASNPGIKTRLRLRRARTGQTIADVVTRRVFVGDHR
jgi:probable biosynthetic protein (TIGR04098 family)